jgi:hypothetical protein
MASTHENKNHTEIQYKISYDEGSELLHAALTLVRGMANK